MLALTDSSSTQRSADSKPTASESPSSVSYVRAPALPAAADLQTGYSLGGLIARTLVGQLYARPGFFARHRPAFFSTIATPHLGVLRYGSWRSAWMHAVGQHMFSRTGQQLFCLDSDHGDPFLVVLADPCEWLQAG